MAEDTISLGRRLGEKLFKERLNCVVSLVGPLGAGKTTFAEGVAEGLNTTGYVESPTFVFLKIYGGEHPLYHYDLYRVDRISDIDDLGLFEMMNKRGVHIVEWGEKIAGLVDFDMEVKFEISGETERIIKISTLDFEELLSEISVP
jgi:tRNA threonylcarbamoyladenosine biosynthesis protein TsaE